MEVLHFRPSVLVLQIVRNREKLSARHQGRRQPGGITANEVSILFYLLVAEVTSGVLHDLLGVDNLPLSRLQNILHG